MAGSRKESHPLVGKYRTLKKTVSGSLDAVSLFNEIVKPINLVSFLNFIPYSISMKIAELIQLMDATFHPEYQEEYDNSGFLLGDSTRDITGVITAVDLTEAVVRESVEKNANMIVTHHPFIFNGLKRITTDNTVGRIVLQLVENKIAVYAAHTNLDNLKTGVNGILAAHLGITDCNILRTKQGNPEIGAGMVGLLPKQISTTHFLTLLKESLQIGSIRVCADALKIHDTIQKIALCGGAGKFLIGDAIAAGADIYLTSDLKYHDFQEADGKIVLVDIGHYESEQLSRQLLAETIDSLSNGQFRTIVATTCDRWERWI